MPKVSVIITTYNRSHYVGEAIDSVLAQGVRDFEIIVVDDGSSDNTGELLKKYTSSIKYIYQKNKGRAEARNAGIKIAKGDYIAFLDDDDIWLPHKLEKQVQFLDSHPDIGLVNTFIEIVDEYGHILKKETKEHLKLYNKAMHIGYTYEGMSQMCVMFISTVMLRKEHLDKIGYFEHNTETFEDWDLYLRFALKYRITVLPEILVRFRQHPMHSTQEEFTHGRIQVSLKHLAIVESSDNLSSANRIRYNFYIHLTNAYYISMQFALFRTYARKVLRLNPLLLFYSRIGLQFLFSLIPIRFIFIIRQLKKLSFRKSCHCLERVDPRETKAGSLNLHLNRYDFAKTFCIDKVVLDAACGVGYGSDYLSTVAKEIIGIDISKEAIQYAKDCYQHKNIQFMVMDICNLEFTDGYFDVVCSFEIIEHLDYPAKCLIELQRVLKENGILVISTPQVKKTTSNPMYYYHKIEFSKDDFKQLLEKYFSKVEIFGQRRLRPAFYYYLQKIDVFRFRKLLFAFMGKKIRRILRIRLWDEADLNDFIINKDKMKYAAYLIGVCYK